MTLESLTDYFLWNSNENLKIKQAIPGIIPKSLKTFLAKSGNANFRYILVGASL